MVPIHVFMELLLVICVVDLSSCCSLQSCPRSRTIQVINPYDRGHEGSSSPLPLLPPSACPARCCSIP
ncbi:Putative dual specificity protein phosphatase DSP8 [Zea mays]|uniref:Putative dual specificity protein phosphatase DSP8 n=1 Tax=Zea mays TaxID=4577 RepID=A0A1D6KY87_MAIZE|nr:Putative dual specificity protein phosphatase DSP8 [Zea mays]ONM07325.1 Putative dual specificity protein phosphatase DSP8 [Zea mays]ONM07335.1 Putative dual specificity protein phosphatase DSP8 [Zea mays]ONM07342.1 Putative dual specificity protein phosphatase DSP8 [Zea mays]ONM07346.1 Putative dual specificity protein phosphatase DSP8 [Zea mays]